MRNKKSLIQKTLIFISVIVIIAFISFAGRAKRNGDIVLNILEPTKTISPSPIFTPTNTPTPTPFLFQGLTTEKFYITFYGWPDNSPAGREIAYPKRRFATSKHNQAGGTGTYEDPITFATNSDKILPGTIYYIPYLQKYVIMEDLCASCKKNVNHLDVWMESNSNFDEEVENCEAEWTRKTAYVVTKPTPNLPVEKTPLFKGDTGICNNY